MPFSVKSRVTKLQNTVRTSSTPAGDASSRIVGALHEHFKLLLLAFLLTGTACDFLNCRRIGQ